MLNGKAHSSSLLDFVEACPTPAVLFARASCGGDLSISRSNQHYDSKRYDADLRRALAQDTTSTLLAVTGTERWIVTHLHSPSGEAEEILCIRTEEASTTDKKTAQEEDIFERWRKHNVPGVDRAAADKHLQYMRDVKWEATSMGRISDWSETVISQVGQALAAPFPICLGFGQELICG